MGKYQSGQMGQTVNLLAYAFGGSNPSLPTTKKRNRASFFISTPQNSPYLDNFSTYGNFYYHKPHQISLFYRVMATFITINLAISQNYL